MTGRLVRISRPALAAAVARAPVTAAHTWPAQPWQLHPGATASELEAPLPSHHILSHPAVAATRAISVQAHRDARSSLPRATGWQRREEQDGTYQRGGADDDAGRGGPPGRG